MGIIDKLSQIAKHSENMAKNPIENKAKKEEGSTKGSAPPSAQEAVQPSAQKEAQEAVHPEEPAEPNKMAVIDSISGNSQKGKSSKLSLKDKLKKSSGIEVENKSAAGVAGGLNSAEHKKAVVEPITTSAQPTGTMGLINKGTDVVGDVKNSSLQGGLENKTATSDINSGNVNKPVETFTVAGGLGSGISEDIKKVKHSDVKKEQTKPIVVDSNAGKTEKTQHMSIPELEQESTLDHKKTKKDEDTLDNSMDSVATSVTPVTSQSVPPVPSIPPITTSVIAPAVASAIASQSVPSAPFDNGQTSVAPSVVVAPVVAAVAAQTSSDPIAQTSVSSASVDNGQAKQSAPNVSPISGMPVSSSNVHSTNGTEQAAGGGVAGMVADINNGRYNPNRVDKDNEQSANNSEKSVNIQDKKTDETAETRNGKVSLHEEVHRKVTEQTEPISSTQAAAMGLVGAAGLNQTNATTGTAEKGNNEKIPTSRPIAGVAENGNRTTENGNNEKIATGQPVATSGVGTTGSSAGPAVAAGVGVAAVGAAVGAGVAGNSSDSGSASAVGTGGPASSGANSEPPKVVSPNKKYETRPEASELSDISADRKNNGLVYETDLYKRRFFFQMFWTKRHFTISKNGIMKYYRNIDKTRRGEFEIEKYFSSFTAVDEKRGDHPYRISIVSDKTDELGFDTKEHRDEFLYWLKKITE